MLACVLSCSTGQALRVPCVQSLRTGFHLRSVLALGMLSIGLMLGLHGSARTLLELRRKQKAMGFATFAHQYVTDLTFASAPGYVGCPPNWRTTQDAMQQVESAPPSGYEDLLTIHYARVDETAPTAFNGNQSLLDRHKAFQVKPEMTLHCGFVNQPQSGFRISGADRKALEACVHIAVATSVFGGYEPLRHPNLPHYAVPACWFAFSDDATVQKWEGVQKNASSRSSHLGIWRIVTVQDLPYSDLAVNANVVKLLMHRIFPGARYSVYLDGKAQLLVDPAMLIDAMLLQHSRPYAISAHPDRQDALAEVEATKAHRPKYAESIDLQVQFYDQEGYPLAFDKADTRMGHLVGTVTDVPDSVIVVREHNPLSNLFSCLWFNEIVRFQYREQISFGYVRKRMTLRLPMFIWPYCHDSILVQHDHNTL